ncbi:hypothetical protein LTR17_023860 [Elasticomyces elasticus]|nr:hypothetical protein LTR17_023860 [Elasticomyces elasticus]
MDSLNSTHEVKRHSVHDFGALEIEDFAMDYVAVTMETERRTMLVKLYEAVVVEIAIPLDPIRSDVAALSEQAKRLAQDAAASMPDIKDERAAEESLHDNSLIETRAELEAVEDRVVDAYQVLLKEWTRVIAKTGVSIRELDERYDGTLRWGSMYGSSELGLRYLRDHIFVVPENIKSKSPLQEERKYYQEAWEKVRLLEGAKIARMIVIDHEELKSGYVDAFITAVKLAPSTFAYSGWCATA